jgi:Helicase associated domain./RWD domain.
MKKTTCTTAVASSTAALFLGTEQQQQQEQQAAALLERTVQEIQALNAIYNDDETTSSLDDDNDDIDDESSYTKFTIVSREAFQAAQNIISKRRGQESKHSSSLLLDNNNSLNTSSFVVFPRPGSISLEVRLNVVLTSADGVKFEAIVDITLTPKYPEEAALITKASIIDIDLGREIDEFRQEMNRKSKELSGSEALEDMIQCVQDYTAEYIANYGHERVLDDSWNRRPSYFTSCASPANGTMYHYNHHGGTTIEKQQQQLDCCKITTTTSSSSSSMTMNAATSYSSAGGTKRKRNDVVKVHSRSTIKSYKATKPKRNQSQSRTFEQRLEDLKMFKEEHGHCIVPYTYAKNQPLSNWCSNIRYSYGLLERGLNPTIKMTEERINALRDIGFDFSALKEQHLKRRGQDFDEDGNSSSEQRAGGAYHATIS